MHSELYLCYCCLSLHKTRPSCCPQNRINRSIVLTCAFQLSVFLLIYLCLSHVIPSRSFWFPLAACMLQKISARCHKTTGSVLLCSSSRWLHFHFGLWANDQVENQVVFAFIVISGDWLCACVFVKSRENEWVKPKTKDSLSSNQFPSRGISLGIPISIWAQAHLCCSGSL